MIVRNENLNMVHLSEINTIVIDTTLVSITSTLMCELMDRKIKVVFCDERHNPKGNWYSIMDRIILVKNNDTNKMGR